MAPRNKREYRRRNKRLWCPASETMLVDLWQDNIGGLRGDRKNFKIHQEIAEKLKIAGYNVTRFDVRTKLDNLKRKYRLESSTSSWTLYKRIHSFLGEISCIDMEDEDMTESPRIETISLDLKSEDSSDDPKEPIVFIEEPEEVAVNFVGLSEQNDNDATINRRESLDDMIDSKHVAATNYIRSLLCQLPYNVAQNLSFELISNCQKEIKKYSNGVVN